MLRSRVQVVAAGDVICPRVVIAAAVDEWIPLDSDRGKARYVHDRDKTLVWAASAGTPRQTPTSLAERIILQAADVSP